MRIVGGKYKGRHISPGKKFKARPTTDIAKEALFNILWNTYDFEDLKVLDLFSGTGGISYEFASRGCLDITSVELNFSHVKFIQSVCSDLKIESMKVLRSDAFRFIENAYQSYDIIFADPPFEHERLKELPQLVLGSRLVDDNTLVIIEHPKNFEFSDEAHFIEERKYGHVRFSMFSKSVE